MAEASISDFFYETPESDVKRRKLIECNLTGNSKQYLGKAYTEEQVNKVNAKEVDTLFSNYEAKLPGQMVKSLGKLIIRMCPMGACTVLGMTNQNALSKDLESDYYLNSALQRFTCNCTTDFGSFLVPPSIKLITSRHYLLEHGIKMEEQMEMIKQPTSLSKYASLEAAITAGLMIVFLVWS